MRPQALALAVLLQLAVAQHYFHLRPVPSDSLPLLELKEDPDPVYDPKERDFNETELRGTLGDFDARFLSVFAPNSDGYHANEDFQEVQPSPQKLGGVLPKEIRAVDLDSHLGKKLRASKKLKRRLQQWLWAYSFCPVVYAWTDLGTRFWPRYVRAGTCLNERSCSVPEGMRCRSASATHLSLLRWRCRKGGFKCAWIPVQYPIITDCKCACDS